MSVDSEDSVEPMIGRTIADKIELLDVLGAGAMGKVFRAKHLALDKIVAIKVLHPQEDGVVDPQRAARFKAEARAASRLDHPNSVQILDFGEDGDDKLLYLTMEFLEGKNLQSILQDSGPMMLDRIARVMVQMLSALAAAHDHGVLHRDIKPGNVVLCRKTTDDGVIDDHVKVCDFGLAKLLNTDGTSYEATSGPLTVQGAVFGTPAYMSPEQARGEPLDARSDLYSCGVIMYKMATGRTPFPAETPWGVLLQHMNDPPDPPSALNGSIDPQLEEIILRSMRKPRDDRYQTARQMRQALIDLCTARGIDLGGSAAAVRAYSKFPPAGTQSVTNVVAPSVESGEVDVSSTYIRQGSRPEIALDLASVSAQHGQPDPATLQTFHEAHSQPGAVIGGARGFGVVIVGAIALAAAVIVSVFMGRGPSKDQVGQWTAPIEDVAPKQVAADARQPAVAAGPSASPTRDPAPPAPAADSEAYGARADPPPRGVQTAGGAKPARAAGGTKRRVAQAPKMPAAETDSPAPDVDDAAASDPRPPEVEVEVESAASDPRPPEIEVEAEPAAAAPAPVPAPAPQPAPKPSGPAPLSASFQLKATIDELSVIGGISTRRTGVALERHLGDAKACLRTALLSHGVEASGAMNIQATVTNRGRLRDLSAEGGLSSASACLADAFSKSRLPKPDTGNGRVRFALKYWTVQ